MFSVVAFVADDITQDVKNFIAEQNLKAVNSGVCFPAITDRFFHFSGTVSVLPCAF